MNHQKVVAHHESIYEDFELLIGNRVDLGYPLSIAQSPAGEADTYSIFDPEDDEIRDILDALMERDTDEAFLIDLGTFLFNELFTGEIGELYHASLNMVRRQQRRLRIRLNIKPPEFAAIPWEYLYDADEEL